MDRTRCVALLIETSRGYGRGLARGVAQYIREHGPWSVYFQSRGIEDPPPPWLKDWQGHGILARINDRRTAAAILHAGLPAVDLRGVIRDTGLPFVGVDNRGVVQLVVEHFLQRGFRHFGFCGLPPRAHVHMDLRRVEFAAQLRQRGYGCSVFPAVRPGRRRNAWDWEQERIGCWLAALPKPVAVMACHDDRGVQVLDACRGAHLAVPDQVAVVGVDNDQPLCEFAIPPLTSVDLAPERIGYEAAALLERLMDGAAPPPRPILIPPACVIARRSSEILASDEESVVRAVRFIRAHACQRIHVRDVLREARLSRTAIEPRFKAVVGRTIHQEIQRTRLAQAQELLAGTDLPIKQVAHRCGFQYVQYLIRVFKRTTGCTPAQYRRRRRNSQPATT
jgi:LacI family transcriptional regulator